MLDTISSILTSVVPQLTGGVLEMVDYVIAVVEDAPGMLKDAVLALVGEVKGLLRGILEEQVDNAVQVLVEALLQVRSLSALKTALVEAAQQVGASLVAALRNAARTVGAHARRLVRGAVEGVVEGGIAASAAFTAGLERLQAAVHAALDGSVAALDLVGKFTAAASALVYKALAQFDALQKIPGCVAAAVKAAVTSLWDVGQTQYNLLQTLRAQIPALPSNFESHVIALAPEAFALVASRLGAALLSSDLAGTLLSALASATAAPDFVTELIPPVARALTAAVAGELNPVALLQETVADLKAKFQGLVSADMSDDDVDALADTIAGVVEQQGPDVLAGLLRSSATSKSSGPLAGLLDQVGDWVSDAFDEAFGGTAARIQDCVSGKLTEGILGPAKDAVCGAVLWRAATTHCNKHLRPLFCPLGNYLKYQTVQT